MGYELHITRADDWASNEGSAIEPSEWLELIDRDTSLRLAGYNGPYFANWDGDPDDPEAWLDLVDGNITTKNPSAALLQKMLEVAERLDAVVQGDEGELYDGTTLRDQTRAGTLWLWGSSSLVSLILSLVALTMLAIAIPLDSFIRQEHPVGAPMPLKLAFLVLGPVAVGVLSWLVSGVLAVAALVLRQRSWWYAAAALAINCATGTYLALAQ